MIKQAAPIHGWRPGNSLWRCFCIRRLNKLETPVQTREWEPEFFRNGHSFFFISYIFNSGDKLIGWCHSHPGGVLAPHYMASMSIIPLHTWNCALLSCQMLLNEFKLTSWLTVIVMNDKRVGDILAETRHTGVISCSTKYRLSQK